MAQPIIIFLFGLPEAKQQIKPSVLVVLFGPGGLRAAPVVVDENGLGHCFHLLFFFFFLFLFLLRLLLFTHLGESPVRENLFPPIFWHN